MNIKEIFFKNQNSNSETQLYVSSSRRSIAAMVDILIVLFLRGIFAEIMGMVFVNQALQNFYAEFNEKFGTELAKNNPDHINFIVHHRIFLIMLTFLAAIILIGAFYHALLNSSAWQATIGKRLAGIAISNKDGSRINFNTAFTHYFLSLLPFIFVIYLISFHLKHHVTIFSALTFSWVNVLFGLIFLFWTQIHVFTKEKTTAYDLICKTIFLKKRTAAKFPWSEEKISNFL